MYPKIIQVEMIGQELPQEISLNVVNNWDGTDPDPDPKPEPQFLDIQKITLEITNHPTIQNILMIQML